MDKILCFTAYMKRVFHTKGWWYIVPFAGIGLILMVVYYIYTPIYMLLDYLHIEMKKIVYKDNENLSWSAQFIKFFFAFMFYIVFAITVVFGSVPLAIIYFLKLKKAAESK